MVGGGWGHIISSSAATPPAGNGASTSARAGRWLTRLARRWSKFRPRAANGDKIEGARQALRRELAKSRIQLDAELAKIGLKRKGSEIRGWSRGATAARAANGRPSPRLPSGGMTVAVVGRGVSNHEEQIRRVAA